MNKDKLISEKRPGCEVQCVLDWVECMEREDGATICKSHQNVCVGDCS
jgi:hypothetical protein